jgi:hypothetical protein
MVATGAGTSQRIADLEHSQQDMITLVPFYRDLHIEQESRELQTNAKIFDYRQALSMMLSSYEITNPHNNYIISTDLNTALPDIPQERLHRVDLAQHNLMQSLIMANTKFVASHVGRFLLCGVDHIFTGPIDQMFQDDDFDLGVMYYDQRVNNTAVLVDTSRTKKHGLLSSFFALRERCYNRLEPQRRAWDGDQATIRMALTEWGFPTLHALHLVDRTFESNGLRVKFWWYNKRHVGGARKFAPRYDPEWCMVDFKGPQRKQWFLPVYQEVMRASQDQCALPAKYVDKQGVALEGPWVTTNPLPMLPNIAQRNLTAQRLKGHPDFYIIWNNITNNRNNSCPDAYQHIKDSGRPWIVGEVPIFRGRDTNIDVQRRYYRWSWLSYFHNTGIHYHENSPRDRWLRLQRDLHIEVHPWRTRGDNILFVMQKPRDNSMQALRLHWGSFERMFVETVHKIRMYSQRPIRVRLHPNNHAQQMNYLRPLLEQFPDISISPHSVEDDTSWTKGSDSLEKDLNESWCVVGGNSNVLVESACLGVPTHCLHPTAMAWPVNQPGLEYIEQPDLGIDRTQWLWNMAYTQWRHDEVLRGLPWLHLGSLYEQAVARLADPFIVGAYWPVISRQNGEFDAKR